MYVNVEKSKSKQIGCFESCIIYEVDSECEKV